MENERHLNDISVVMTVLNLAVIVYYCLVCGVTTGFICDAFGAYGFLSSVRQVPQQPWHMPVCALSLYLLLIMLGYGKAKWDIRKLWGRVLLCAAEIVLCFGVIASLRFYYSGVALLVLADLVHYVQRNRFRICFMAVLILLYAFAKFEIVSLAAAPIAFSAYLGYYSQFARGYLTSIESVLVSMNILLFVLYMILLFTGERTEKERIRKLNEQLNEANAQLRDYAVEMERMAEVRERNRLAREIHDTLGHTLTGIIMGSDAALALFSAAPEEARERIQVIAQSAREGLTDVRRSIKALRPDALEKHSLAEALEGLVTNFRTTTGVEITYEQQAGPLAFAPDEEDTIYRVVQESMTNAVRHGRAGRIEIRLTRRENLLTVDVRDDGRGCEQVTDGFGLRHMRERLALLGGTLACGNRGGTAADGHRGFYVTVTVPVREKEVKAHD